MKTILRSNFLNPVNHEKCDFLSDYCLTIDEQGKIESIEPYSEKAVSDSDKLIDLSNCLVTPGFIDLHSHLPQYSAIGIGKGTLLSWLSNYIIPLESKFSDEQFAREQSVSFFNEALSLGTTTIVTYCSIHRNATSIAFETASDIGIRAFIGNSLIDLPNEAGYFSALGNIKSDIDFLVNKYHLTNTERLRYIVTPRYAGSCTKELMSYCANFAKSNDLFIQTHLAENKSELELMKKLHPEFDKYTEIYDKTGLLTDKTLLAHCIYLEEAELAMIQNAGSIVCHCPTSNRYLSSGIMPLVDYQKIDLRIGLGTDVAAGYSLSMLNEAKEAIETSKSYDISKDVNGNDISASYAFYLSTKGAAENMNIADKVGAIQIGLDADLAIFELDSKQLSANSEDFLRSLIYNKFNQTAKAVLIAGKCVYGNL
ncbi:MAG: amidohydrolase family protein [Candidatus Kapabacteria bacterium]|nr:amidohydrolase family protein [Candidatus Kapabacteria bacterium]